MMPTIGIVFVVIVGVVFAAAAVPAGSSNFKGAPLNGAARLRRRVAFAHLLTEWPPSEEASLIIGH